MKLTLQEKETLIQNLRELYKKHPSSRELYKRMAEQIKKWPTKPTPLRDRVKESLL